MTVAALRQLKRIKTLTLSSREKKLIKFLVDPLGRNTNLTSIVNNDVN